MTLRSCLGGAAVVVALFGNDAAAEKQGPPKRAKPPQWSQDALDEFFVDAREQLVGKRPEKHAHELAASQAEQSGRATSGGPAGASGAKPWSQAVSGETLAAEVKRLSATLRDPLTNPAKFKGGGYKDCREAFNALAVLFAVIAEYDGDVRWQEDAPALRDRLARAARNCKTGTDQTFAEAAQLRMQIDDLIRGERLGGEQTPPPERWSDVADRPLLMQRMETALEERISPALSNAREFSRRSADVQHEAETLALLAMIIDRAEFDYWDDETFQKHSGSLREASQALSRAASETNYEAARAAAGRAEQSCSVCHEGYRG